MIASKNLIDEKPNVRAPQQPGGRALSQTDVLGVPVARIQISELLDFCDHVLEEKAKGWIGYVNIHTVNLAREIPWFQQYLRGSLLNYCDGQGVRLGSYLLGSTIPIRITLADYWTELCNHFEKIGVSVYFLGTDREALDKAINNVRLNHPKLRIAGWHHGYFPFNNGIDVISQINKVKPDILFVGMSMPTQEEWIRRNIGSLNVIIAWSAGGLFDILAGVRKKCPTWVSELGFEWMFRFFQEPARLWKRYFLGNPLFLYRVLRTKFSNRVHGQSNR